MLDLELEAVRGGEVICTTNARHLYWSPEQQLAHATSNGATIRPGDLFGSGTVSGPEPQMRACLLETQGPFLEDGEEIVLRGRTPDGAIELGEVRGTVLPRRTEGQPLSGSVQCVGGGEVEVAVVGAQALRDERRGGAAEHRGVTARAVERQAAQEAGAEGVAAAGRVDDVDRERRHLLDAVGVDDDRAVGAARRGDAADAALRSARGRPATRSASPLKPSTCSSLGSR